MRLTYCILSTIVHYRFFSSASVISKVQSSIVAGLVGDSLSLSTHYEYDAKKIKAYFGKVSNFGAPRVNNGIGKLIRFIYLNEQQSA